MTAVTRNYELPSQQIADLRTRRNPCAGFAEAYHLRARILGALNRQTEAIEAQKKATELDPFSKPGAMVRSLRDAGQYDAAIEDAQQRLESFPRNLTLLYLMWDTYRRKGMYTEAMETLIKQKTIANDPQGAAAVQRAYAQGGYKAVVRWQLSETEKVSKKEYVPPADFANLYAQLGDRERTLALLEAGFREHSPRLLWIQTEPAYDFLHSDPRYRSLIQRVGLPPAY